MDKTYTPQELMAACAEAGVSEVGGYGYREHLVIQSVFGKDLPATVKWATDFNNRYRAPPDITEETTFEDCVSWSFDVKSKILTVTMFDGDNFSGHRTDRRCEWEFRVTDQHRVFFTKLLNNRIISSLMTRARITRDLREQKRIQAEVNGVFNEYFK